jgi:hypothetical protein
MCPFNTVDCLIEVTEWAGLTIIYLFENVCFVPRPL